MSLAVFRCDASAEIGAGHVFRSMVLADALWGLGWETIFLSKTGTTDMISAFDRRRHAVIEGDRDQIDDPHWIEKAIGVRSDLLVVDHYQLEQEFEKGCRNFAESILALDDLADRHHDCDVLVDQGRSPGSDQYASLCPEDADCLFGPRYALLRPQFLYGRLVSLARRRGLSQAQRLIVSFGAVDGRKMVPATLSLLADISFNGVVDVLVGKHSNSFDEAKQMAPSLPFEICLHEDVHDVASLMVRADAAIGACGGTAWERCCLGLPALVFATADNQLHVAEVLASSRAALLFGSYDQIGDAITTSAIAEKLDDGYWLAGTSEAAARLCDGLGVGRVLAAVLPEFGRNGSPIHLREARLEDAELIYRWQCHPDTRRYFHNPEAPTWNEHVKWFKARIDAQGSIYRVVERNGQPAGVLRLDGTENQDYVVSILVGPDNFRQGIGLAALRLARKLVPHARLLANVDPENRASTALFENAGYVFEDGVFQNRPKVI